MLLKSAGGSRVSIGGDLSVNRLGFGAGHLTGPGSEASYVDRAHAIALLRRAVDLGIDLIDTADMYGPGDNERIIRDALHPYPKHLVLMTKGGLQKPGPKSLAPYTVPHWRPAYLRQQLELSLRILGVETIDLYQLQTDGNGVPLEQQLGELADLQQEGKIRHIGVGGSHGLQPGQLAHARSCADITAVGNPHHLLEASAQACLDYAEAYQLAYLCGSPLAGGSLAHPEGPFAAAAARRGVSAAQLALAWVLRKSPNTVVTPSTTSLAHLKENVASAQLQLSSRDIGELTELPPTPISTAPQDSGRLVARGRVGGEEHPHVQLLRRLYSDLTRIGDFVNEDEFYQLVARDLLGGPNLLRGRAALVANHSALFSATDGTLVARVDSVTANEHFGTVLGTFHATMDGKRFTLPFCGLWQFLEGRIIHHRHDANVSALVVSGL